MTFHGVVTAEHCIIQSLLLRRRLKCLESECWWRKSYFTVGVIGSYIIQYTQDIIVATKRRSLKTDWHENELQILKVLQSAEYSSQYGTTLNKDTSIFSRKYVKYSLDVTNTLLRWRRSKIKLAVLLDVNSWRYIWQSLSFCNQSSR